MLFCQSIHIIEKWITEQQRTVWNTKERSAARVRATRACTDFIDNNVVVENVCCDTKPMLAKANRLVPAGRWDGGGSAALFYIQSGA